MLTTDLVWIEGTLGKAEEKENTAPVTSPINSHMEHEIQMPLAATLSTPTPAYKTSSGRALFRS